MKTSAIKWLNRAVSILSLLLILPSISYAGWASVYASQDSAEANSQNVSLLQPVNPSSTQIAISGNALYSEAGPSGTIADISDITPTTQISTYVVRQGDTLSAIAKMFDVSVNTIIWANDGLTAKNLKQGQALIILPVTGIRHKVVKGDTISSIVAKYKVRLQDVLDYNDITVGSLSIGETIIIPDAELPYIPSDKPKLTAALHGASGPSYPGYYIRPVGGVKTQGLHGFNGVDLAATVGTPIHASAAGTVIIAKNDGLWNQGYGNYVVVSHPNGTQTLYAHASRVVVTVGQRVSQGEVLALSGNTGKSTGPHVHFEIRGARNPF